MLSVQSRRNDCPECGLTIRNVLTGDGDEPLKKVCTNPVCGSEYSIDMKGSMSDMTPGDGLWLVQGHWRPKEWS